MASGVACMVSFSVVSRRRAWRRTETANDQDSGLFRHGGVFAAGVCRLTLHQGLWSERNWNFEGCATLNFDKRMCGARWLFCMFLRAGTDAAQCGRSTGSCKKGDAAAMRSRSGPTSGAGRRRGCRLRLRVLACWGRKRAGVSMAGSREPAAG
jgi:hypothetical protein